MRTIKVKFVDYWPESHSKQYALFKPIVGTNVFSKAKNLIIQILTLFRRYHRINTFKRFSLRYLELPNKVKYPIDQQLIPENFDCVIVGSDQIWRNHISAKKTIGFDSVYFGQNFKPAIPCISYAASMGIIEMNNAEENLIKKYLKRFDTILVREHNLKELIEKLGYTANVVLDPTLLLTYEEWNKLLPKTRYREEKYVLYYELIPSVAARTFAKQKAKKLGCKLLVMDAVIHTLPKIGHISYASPIEFLHTIRDAEYIIATSFHGTAFSIIFNKQFITIGLKKNSDRVRTLLNSLGINEHYQEHPADVPPINYEEVNKLCTKIKKQSLDLLNEAINKYQ